MASTGIQRKIDDLGRVVIPVGVRRTLGISEGDRLEVTVEGERVILAKPHDRCMLCSAEEGLVEARGRKVCVACVDELSDARSQLQIPSRLLVLDEAEEPTRAF